MPDLLIVGASVRAATQSASRAGLSVVAADLFADQDTRSAADVCIRVNDYPSKLVEIRDRYANVPLVYTGALENHPQLIEQLSRLGPMFGNSANAIRNVRDPFHLRDTLSRHEIPFPATVLVPSIDSVTPDRKWLKKSFRSAGGFHVADVDHSNLSVDTNQWYFQEKIDGTVCSAAYVGFHRHAVLIGTTTSLVGCAWAGTKGYVYCGSMSRQADAHELLQWQRLGTVVTQEFGLTGVFGIDAIVRDHCVIPIEVNPRFTASIEVLEHESDWNAIGNHVRAFQNRAVGSKRPRRQFAGKIILFATEDLVMPSKLGVTAADVTLADIPAAGECIEHGRPIVSIVVLAQQQQDVLGVLRGAAEEVQRKLSA